MKSPGFVPGAGHEHAEVNFVPQHFLLTANVFFLVQDFWQNVSTAVGCAGGHLDCMRKVKFSTLNTATNAVKNNYTYQFQPRVDGDFVADTCTSAPSNTSQSLDTNVRGITDETQFYQKRFNFNGSMVISHELHEANGQAWSGVNTTADVSTYLKIFFPSITDGVVQQILDLYPESQSRTPFFRHETVIRPDSS